MQCLAGACRCCQTSTQSAHPCTRTLNQTRPPTPNPIRTRTRARPPSRALYCLKTGSFCITLLSVIGSVLCQSSGWSQECSLTFDARSPSHGTFASPDIDRSTKDAPTIDCLFKFRAPENKVVWIEWEAFELREPMLKNNQCLYNYVEVTVTDYQDQQHVSGRYCGSKHPPPLRTMQDTVDVRFHSENSITFSGFKAKYKFLSEQEVGEPESKYDETLPSELKKACGGIAQGAHSGIIQSPGYPRAYPGGVECNWLIRVPPGMKISVQIDDLHLTAGLQCGDVAMYIVDGYKHSTMQHAAQHNNKLALSSQVRLCGNMAYHKRDGQHDYMSDQNRMIIRFVANRPPDPAVDFSPNGRVGFRLIWTAVSLSDDKPCKQFLCSGGEYCIDQGGKVCTTGKQYCIHNSLQCNGVPNCAENDNSDEENCYALQIVFAAIGLLGFLLFVIVAVICCQRRRNVQYLERMKRERLPSQSLNDRPCAQRQIGHGTPASHVTAHTTIDHTSPNARGALLNTCTPRKIDSNLQTTHQNLHDQQVAGTGLELKAMPANYHGYNSTGCADEPTAYRRQPMAHSDDDEHRPFLTSNHVSASDSDTQTMYNAPGHHRKPLRVCMPPISAATDDSGFVSAHAQVARVWQQHQQPPARASSAQPPHVSVRARVPHPHRHHDYEGSLDTDQMANHTPVLHHSGGSAADCVMLDDDLRLHYPTQSHRGNPGNQSNQQGSLITCHAKPAYAGSLPRQARTHNPSPQLPNTGTQRRKQVEFADEVREPDTSSPWRLHKSAIV